MRRNSRGFTLVEIMLVVVIIGLLASIVGINIRGLAPKSKEKTVRAQISNFETVVDVFSMENDRLPRSLDELVNDPGGLPDWKAYMRRMPKDPWGNSYQYKSPGAHNDDFDIFSMGPDAQPGTDDDIGNWAEDED